VPQALGVVPVRVRVLRRDLLLPPFQQRGLAPAGDARPRIAVPIVLHNLLDRPRDAPRQTAIGFGMLTWVLLIFLAGAADRVDVLFGFAYATEIWVYRVLAVVLPPVAGAIAYRVCRELQRGEQVEHVRTRARQEAEAAHGAVSTWSR
jgi:hypothetical protein